MDACLTRQDIRCDLCSEVCHHDAITFIKRYPRAPLAIIDADLCIGCNECISACIVEAISSPNEAATTNI